MDSARFIRRTTTPVAPLEPALAGAVEAEMQGGVQPILFTGAVEAVRQVQEVAGTSLAVPGWRSFVGRIPVVTWVAIGSLVAVGAAWFLRTHFFSLPSGMKVKDGISAFAVIYVIAQAIERALEPLSHLDPKKRSYAKNRGSGDAKGKRGSGATERATVLWMHIDAHDWRQVRTLVLWAAATIIGMMLSAALGVRFLAMIIASNPPDPSLDVLITGIVVGGGSKAVHDVIANVQQTAGGRTAPAGSRTTWGRRK